MVCSTTVVNCKTEEFDVYIGRGSIWGNPFTHLTGKTKAQYIVATRREAIENYRAYLLANEELMKLLPTLKGKRLGCYCKPKSCHGDILAELADKTTYTISLF